MARIRARWAVAAAPVVIALAMSTLGMTSSHSGASSLAGSAGTDVSLPVTPSAKTVAGRDAFASLKVTVNQTADLVNQAVSVSWTGGMPTYSDAATKTFNGHYAGDYLQIFQCWGDDDGTVPANPGPPPQQCEFGGESAKPQTYPVRAVTFPYERIISVPAWTCGPTAPVGCLTYQQQKDLATRDPSQASLDPTGFVVSPFRAVDGTLVPSTVDYNYALQIPYKAHDINPYFSFNTTNEVDFSRTYSDGSGQELFQVDTGLEAPGLGCGQKVQKRPDGSLVAPRCWLVAVPRGTSLEENMTGDPSQGEVDTSPLTPTAWRHRIAIPLNFNPIGSVCPVGASLRRIVGSELAAIAVANWQPTLCSVPGTSPFSYGALPDDRARTLLLGSGQNGAGMAVMSRPIDPPSTDPQQAPVYAPLTLSGAVIGFNIQRTPRLGPDGEYLADQLPISGRRVATLRLTPRLVAKLLTESYLSQLYPGLVPPGYTWAVHNPHTIIEDAEFVRFNPEFAELVSANSVESSGMVVEQQSSDAAFELWQWILADKEAKAWLDGRPDESGMRVNPYYATTAKASHDGTPFASSPPSNFPKSDPYCWTPPDTGYDVGFPPQKARNLCVQDWAPYVLTMRAAAAAARSTNTGANTVFNPGAAESSSAWSANGPQSIGTNFVLSVTDSAQAARFGLQTAALSRSGDDGVSRIFVAPTESGLLTGASAMKPSGIAGVVVPDPATSGAGAYPLPMLTYAATIPSRLDAAARTDYARFLTFAAGPGQRRGTSFGSLPPGYVSLPSSLARRTLDAADAVLHPRAASPPLVASAPGPDLPTDGAVSGPTSRSPEAQMSDEASSSFPPSNGSTDLRSGSGGTTQRDRLAPSIPVPTAPAGDQSVAAGPGATISASDVPPAAGDGRAALAAARTPSARVGAVALLIPLGLLSGVAALAGSVLSGAWRRQRTI